MTTEETAPDDPGEHTLRHVPVRTVGTVQVLRLFRQRDGSRCAVEFSTVEGLRSLLGPEQESAELTEPMLRELTRPLGIGSVVLDPGLVAPPVRETLHAVACRLEPRW